MANEIDINNLKEQNYNLAEENKKLQEQLDAALNSQKKSGAPILKLGYKGLKLWAGADLKKSLTSVFEEFPKVTKPSFAYLIASLIKRLTRIGVFTMLFAVIPLLILFIQTFILFQQNNKLEQQVHLEEATRSNSMVFLMDNVLNQITTDLKTSGGNNKIKSSTIARANSLIYGFRPYRFLENGDLIDKPLSPEKGQFLLALIYSGIDKKQIQQIFKTSSFSHTYLKNSNLFGQTLENIEMPSSNLEGADLSTANLKNAELKYSNFSNASLRNADLRDASFSNVNLTDTALTGAKVSESNWLDKLDDWNVIGHDFIKSNYKLVKSTKGSFYTIKLKQ